MESTQHLTSRFNSVESQRCSERSGHHHLPLRRLSTDRRCIPGFPFANHGEFGMITNLQHGGSEAGGETSGTALGTVLLRRLGTFPAQINGFLIAILRLFGC
jgi:hypothetical protein